jgi:hypothetical protein
MKKQLFWLTALTAVSIYAQDPPSRVARLNFVQGSVSFQPGTLDEWSAASLNYPLTTGDHLYTDRGGRAELEAGGASIRLESGTDVTILNLDDRTLQISVTSGAVNVRVRRFYAGDVVEIDTPNGAVSLTRAGEYRVDTEPDRNATMVTVLNGEAEMFNSGESFPVHARQTGFFNGDGSAQVDTANPPDNFDSFAYTRDRREDAPPSPYVSREMIGYQDLQEYGTWRDASEYGPVWVPRVNAGWAPYRDGHWAWVAPWGWTWVDDAPWGFAPFHYGRWAYLGDTWGWVPGPVVSRPVYAPALVAFVGGNNWGVSLGFGGGGGGVGWFPLGPRDLYVPSYHVSRNYVNQVNITNVRNINAANINNINNFRNVTYMNQNVPNAVTAISRQDFASSRAVRQVAVPVPVRALMGSQIINNAPIAPQRLSVLGGQSRANVGFVRPPATGNARPVFVRNAPPPAPVPFAVRQQAEAATPGRPLDPAMLQRLQQSSPAQRSMPVRPVTAMPARPQTMNPAQPGFNQQRPNNVPQQTNVPFTRQQSTPNPQAAPQNPNFDRMRQQNSSSPIPFTRQPAGPGVAPQQTPAANADAERQRQMQLQLEQQRQQQLQRQQTAPAPNADAERQRQMQLQLEQQRQQQLQRQQIAPVPNADTERQRQMQLQLEQQRQQQLQRQQTAPPPNADAERQRQMQLQLEQQRQQQLQRQQTAPAPNADAERQRQMQIEQQRQQQMQRQNPNGQVPYTRQQAAPAGNPPQPNADVERQRQMQLQINQQRQQQLDQQRQQQLQQQRQQPQQQVAPPRPPQNQRPAPPPDPKRDEKPKDDKKPNNQGF